MEVMTKVLKLCNKVFDSIVIILIVIALLYSGYCLWDNAQIYKGADIIHDIDKEEVMQLGNSTSEDANSIIAWMEIEDTSINFPIVQGKDNVEYLSKDIYGNYSISGSIYLDSRNNKKFTDEYSIIYGHNMDKHKMFGDLKEYANTDKNYFNTHNELNITLRDEDNTEYKYEILAVFKEYNSDEFILNPEDFDIVSLIKYIRANAINYNAELLDKINDINKISTFVSMVTCSSGHTYEKVIVLAVRLEDKNEIENGETPKDTIDTDKVPIVDIENTPGTGDKGIETYILVLGLAVVLLLMTIIGKQRREKE